MKKSAPYSVVIGRVDQIFRVSKKKVEKKRRTLLLPMYISGLPFSMRVEEMLKIVRMTAMITNSFHVKNN